jgi:glutathione peroxidase
MKPVQIPFAAAFAVILALLMGTSRAIAGDATSLLDHDVRVLGSDRVVNLKEAYGGKVILVVNTASRCAFTDQYEGLEALYSDYRDEGLVVLGFPSNDFGRQEPGTETEIKNFCRLTYGVKFPMFAKTSVQEGTNDPFFVALGEAAGRYPQWNFHKYLLGRDGQLVDDYVSMTTPQSRRLVEAIEAQL